MHPRGLLLCVSGEAETPTPEKDVTYPSDSLANTTLFDLTCQLTCTVNVKWWGKNMYIL